MFDGRLGATQHYSNCSCWKCHWKVELLCLLLLSVILIYTFKSPSLWIQNCLSEFVNINITMSECTYTENKTQGINNLMWNSSQQRMTSSHVCCAMRGMFGLSHRFSHGSIIVSKCLYKLVGWVYMLGSKWINIFITCLSAVRVVFSGTVAPLCVTKTVLQKHVLPSVALRAFFRSFFAFTWQCGTTGMMRGEQG